MADTARDIMARAEEAACDILLPSDVVCATEFAANADNITVAANACPADRMILDAGPETIARINGGVFETARTLIWNGPLGAFEIEPFDKSPPWLTARKAAELTRDGQSDIGCRRGRYRRRAEPGRSGGRLQLYLNRWRRVPGVDGRQDTCPASRPLIRIERGI